MRRDPWTPGDNTVLRNMAGKNKIEVIAERLDRSVAAVRTHASLKGVSLAYRNRKQDRYRK